jgi:acyl carrier protein
MATDLQTIQAELIAIWKELLDVKEVGLEDDFLLLGGNSMIALRVLSRVNERFDFDFPAQALFESATVRDLAAAIAAELKAVGRGPL